MGAAASVSTAGVPNADRLALWGDFVRRYIGRLHTDAYGDHRFDGTLKLNDLGAAKLCRIEVSRHRVVRTPELIRADDRGYVKIVAQASGSGCFEQGGRKAVLGPGDWAIYDTTKAYIAANPEGVLQLAVLLPRERLGFADHELEKLMVRRFSGRAGVGRLAYGLIAETFEAVPAGQLPDGEDLAARLSDLVRQAALERMGRPTDLTLQENARDRIKAFITANLDDPALSLDGVAGALNCSKRYLHKLFRDETETLNEYIWRSRLEMVRRDLDDPVQIHRSITDIAFAWGFNSSAHFSRLFRERYGVSPTGYRTMMHRAEEFWRKLAPAA